MIFKATVQTDDTFVSPQTQNIQTEDMLLQSISLLYHNNPTFKHNLQQMLGIVPLSEETDYVETN